jgi:hypothetical protein
LRRVRVLDPKYDAGRMDWHRFTVDGETYFWTAYASEQRSGDGPWESIEYLNVTRAPDAAGVGRTFPVGTALAEQDAVDLVRLCKAHGREVP